MQYSKTVTMAESPRIKYGRGEKSSARAPSSTHSKPAEETGWGPTKLFIKGAVHYSSAS